MKIAFFHNLPVGGAKKVLFYQVKLLSKAHQIEVFEYDTTDQSDLSIMHLNCVRHVLKDPVNKQSSRFNQDYQTFISLRMLHKQLALVIDKNQYDLVIVHPDRYTQAPYVLEYLRTN